MTVRLAAVRRLLAALLVACVAVPAIALAADTDPKKKITPADRAKARSIVLKRADLAAGWKKVPPGPDADTTCPGYNPNESDLTLTGEAEADYEHAPSATLVSSYAEVYATKADALKSWARNNKPALARCIGFFFHKEVTKEGNQVRIVKAGRMAFPKLAPRTAAFKVVANVTITENGQKRTVPVAIHLLAFGNGRGDTSLYTLSLGAATPTADLRAFGKLLASRLAAAKL
jgi:hypothetical protein